MAEKPGLTIQGRRRCPLCQKYVAGNLRSHIIDAHGEEEFHRAILADKERGMKDAQIGERYGISFSTLEQIITTAYGANVSLLKRTKRIKRWQPSGFREETTTVWGFKQRGDWATHDGRYRGNWSPYIPRNVILKYSRPGDIVLDYFVGGGTTAIEAKLLGRRCIARDINPGAIAITAENLRFSPPYRLPGDTPLYEPEVSVGDARDLSGILDNSVDLICAHPPYAGIIQYSTKIPGDLSELSVQDFLVEIHKVAKESFRVLKPGGKCAILIGDARKSKHVVPIGFATIRAFLAAGFVLRELVIKRQYNCKTTGFWYTRSIQHNFLLLAHEYLPIFEKPFLERMKEQHTLWEYTIPYRITLEKACRAGEENLETTTVWIFPKERLEAEVKRNLSGRFAAAGEEFIDVRFDGDKPNLTPASPENIRLLHVHMPEHETEEAFMGYRAAVKDIVAQGKELLPPGGFLVLEAKDFRTENELIPVGLFLWEDMTLCRDFRLKEIVIVAPMEMSSNFNRHTDYLDIVHRYLLIYRKEDRAIRKVKSYEPTEY